MTTISIPQRPRGSWFFKLFGAVAEFEKDIIRERVVAGLASARRKGKRLGRPPIPEFIYQKAKALRGQGLSFRTIGNQLGIHEGTMRKRLKKEISQEGKHGNISG